MSRAATYRQNEVEAATAVWGALHDLARDAGIALVAVDHLRKSNGFEADPIDDILGSTGKAAVADSILALYRKRGEAEAHLKGDGRDLELVDLMLTWDRVTCCWQPAGRGGLVLKSRVQQDILDALTAADGMGLTTARLAVILGRDKGNISKELQELVARGIVLPCQKQGKEQPYKLNPDYEYHSLN